MRRWAVLLIGVLFLVTITGAGRASATGGTYRVIAGGDQNWTPGSGSIDQTSTDAVRVTGTLTGDSQGHSVGTTDYEVAAGPGIVRARVHGSFQIPSGSAYPYDPSVQGVSSTELTVSGPAGEITTSLNVHVDGFLATPQCGSGTTCGAIGVEIHAGSGVGSEFNSLGDINKNQLGLSFDAVPGGYHVHGDVTTAAMVLPVNAPVPVTLNMSLGGRFSGGPATSTFDGNFDDPVALSQVSFAPSGPVLNNIPAGYTVSGPAVVNNHWADPFATPPPPSDTTAPAVTGIPDRPANVFGWYSGPVTIDWQATDASGQASDPPDTLVTGEGRDMRITSSPSCDPSNNCARGDVTLSIDRTPPTLTCSDLNPVFPVSRNSLAFVFIDVNDQLSGGGGARALGAGVDISSPGQKTVEIAGEDFAGNEALVTCAYTVVDSTAPAVTGIPDRPANVFGWYSGPVTIDWQATDASGQASDPPDTLVTGEGRDMRITSSPSCDPSNNCARGDVTLSIDRTPPTLTCSDLNPVFPVSRNSLAFVFIDVNDQLSGGGGARALGAGVDISSPGQKTVEIAGEDFAGNEALVTCAYTVVDSTAPAVTGTPDRPANVFGWYSGPVTIDWQATDASGQASDPPDTLVTGEGRDMRITSSPSCDPSNNCASGDVTLSIDRTPPTLTCSDPNPVFPVSRNSLAFVFIDVNDQLSGGGGARALGAGVDISSPGQKTVEIAGEDFAGNEALVTCAYTVLLSDSTPPVLTVPAGMAVDATSPAGAQVSFVVTAVDGVDPSPVVLCVPGSGSAFAAGSTTVTCTATDASGNAASRSFTITVAGANAQILRLMVKTRDFLDLPPLRLTLQATLLTAANAQAAGRQVLACTALDLYVAEVWLSPARAFSPAERAALIGDAIRIRAVVGCA